MNSTSENFFVIEKQQPFSKSKIWELQRQYFEKAGIEAWRQGTVPHYITSNPVTGKTYAEIVLSVLKDRAYCGATNEMVYLVELGAGHGRLCYHFLRHFERFYKQCPIKLPPFCYILSDFTQNNVNFWKSHKMLQPYFDKGILDIALFDAEKDTDIYLQRSGTHITPQSQKQPILIIANYFFDTIPQDLFYFKNSSISQCLISLSTDINPSDLSEAQLFEKVKITYDYIKCDSSFYENEIFQDIINVYAEYFKESFMLFPHVGLCCIERIRTLSDEGCVLLTTDKGSHHLNDLVYSNPPGLATHGSFSLNVNFHAIKLFCEKQNGLPLFPANVFFYLDLGCLLFVKDPGNYKDTQLTFERDISDYCPDDFFTLKKLFEKYYDTLTLQDIIAIIRLSNYDAYIFGQIFPRIHVLLGSATNDERYALFQSLHRIWDMYYPLGENMDHAFEIGKILMDLSFPKEALSFFLFSKNQFGMSDKLVQPILSCFCSEKEYGKAIEFLKQLEASS